MKLSKKELKEAKTYLNKALDAIDGLEDMIINKKPLTQESKEALCDILGIDETNTNMSAEWFLVELCDEYGFDDENCNDIRELFNDLRKILKKRKRKIKKELRKKKFKKIRKYCTLGLW